MTAPPCASPQLTVSEHGRVRAPEASPAEPRRKESCGPGRPGAPAQRLGNHWTIDSCIIYVTRNGLSTFSQFFVVKKSTYFVSVFFII